MNWNWLPSFSALSYAWFFLLLIPLVLFYFLKLRRPRMDVPSLALWQSVLNDQRVNSPFQKFRRNLLLLLQLLLLILLVLAAMQPFIQGSPKEAEYRVVLIDNSASMAALDQPGGRSRLDEAKERVRELIDSMRPEQNISIVVFNSNARRVTPFTNNKRVLREALDQLEVVEVVSRPDEAFRMTQALARTVPVEDVVMYTDGNIPTKVDFELPFELNYQKLPVGGANIGITALNARRAGAETWDVFVRIEGSQSAQTAGTISLYQDGEFAGDETLTLEAKESRRIVFRVESPTETSLELRLKPDGFDSLEADNTAYLQLAAAQPLAVYVEPELAAFRHAVRGLKGVELFPGDDGTGGGRAQYDLIVTDRSGEDLPEGTVTLWVGVVPNELSDLVKIDEGEAEIVDWQRASPLLQHVQLLNVETTDVPTSVEDVGEEDFEEFGYQVLAHSRTGPLILQKRDGIFLEYYLLFHTDRSTLPYRVGFPIFVSNLVEVALQSAGLSEVRGTKTGVLPEIGPRNIDAESTYRVTGPGDFREDVKSSKERVLAGVPAPRVGQYRVVKGGDAVVRVGASLLEAQETSLVSVEEIQFEELSVRAAEAEIETDWPLWPYLAMMGFLVLLVEWWFFQRRPGRASVPG